MSEESVSDRIAVLDRQITRLEQLARQEKAKKLVDNAILEIKIKKAKQEIARLKNRRKDPRGEWIRD